jgi:hypothetical protein
VTTRDRGREEGRLHAVARRSAHLTALCALAFAQPLFDILGKNPAFFAVRGSSRGDIVLFALALVSFRRWPSSRSSSPSGSPAPRRRGRSTSPSSPGSSL